MEYAFATMKKQNTPPQPLKRLTAGEQKALTLILDYHQRHGRFPSLREQGREAEYSHQNASLYRDALARKGWLKLDEARGITAAVQPLEGYRLIEGATNAQN